MKSRLRAALPWAIVIVVALVATWLRYGFIEPSDAAHACDGSGGPWWCSTRTLIVKGFLNNAYGYVAVLLAVVSLFWRSTTAAVLAAAAGVFALQLYCYEAGALALLIGALRLVRVQHDQRRPALA